MSGLNKVKKNKQTTNKCANCSYNINIVNGSENNRHSRIYLTLPVRWIYTLLKSNYLYLQESITFLQPAPHTFVSLYENNMPLFCFFPKLLFICDCWSSLGLVFCSLGSVGGGLCSKGFSPSSYGRGAALMSLSDIHYKQPSLLMCSFTASDFLRAYCFLWQTIS